MFTEKDIELADVLIAKCRAHVQTKYREGMTGKDAEGLVNQFIFFKLAKLENQIEELRGGK